MEDHFRDREILIYTDLFDRLHEVIFLRISENSGNYLVKHAEREIWLRPAQVKGTGRVYEKPIESGPGKRSWTIGETVPEHAKKQTKGRSRK